MQLMFVQSAEGLKADDKTLRLVNVSPQAIWFSDRPVRQAGHMSLKAYMKEWTAAAGPNNFSKDPPNATLSVDQPGKDENTLTVVEISDPKVEGKDLVYTLQADRRPDAEDRRCCVAVHRLDRRRRRRRPGLPWRGVGRRGVGWR